MDASRTISARFDDVCVGAQSEPHVTVPENLSDVTNGHALSEQDRRA
jgi:hypothetical protein